MPATRPTSTRSRTDPAYTFVQGDICDPALLGAADRPGTTPVVQLRRRDRTSTARSSAAPDFVPTNVARHPDAVRGRAATPSVQTFVHISTDEVYGSIDDRAPGPRTHPLQPNSPYSAAKAGSDLIAPRLPPTHGLRRRDHPLLQQLRAPTTSRRRSSRCSSPTCWTASRCRSTATARNVRDWLHVDDHCRASSWCWTTGRPGEVYNIGGGTELTNKELTRLLLRHAARTGRSVEYVDRPEGPRPAVLGGLHQDRTDSATSRARCRSTRAWRRPSSGTATTATGGSR